ncbi:MAG: glycosyltransferase, partial [Actinobacteria bacterium]
MTTEPKVSVSLTTYNQRRTIAQAIDSVLVQETSFPVEILVGEDESSDGTRDIVLDYARRYPHIHVLLNRREDVITIDGRPTGRWNFANNLRHVRGQYVALLEGDDYWTSPHKLQKQADFLDAFPDCALCFHAVESLHEPAARPAAEPAG